VIQGMAKAMRMELWVGMAAVILVLSGCATGPNIKESADPYGSLYGGKPNIAHTIESPASSAKEASQRGDEAWRRGNTDLALYNYVRALELAGGDPDILYKIGAIHTNGGNLELAQLAYQMALQGSSDHAGALEGLGLNLLQRRQQKEAEQYLTRAVAIDPARWRAYNGLGVMADLRKDYQLAATHYAAALKTRPDSPLLLNNLGYSNYLAGNLESAQRNLEFALSKNPQYERAWMNLGLMYTRRGQYEEALSAFRQVMDDAEAWNNVGYLCMMDGKYGPAENFILQAISLSPNYYANAHENLKRVHELRSR
jgi:Flp pilus assembly protein TadD